MVSANGVESASELMVNALKNRYVEWFRYCVKKEHFYTGKSNSIQIDL